MGQPELLLNVKMFCEAKQKEYREKLDDSSRMNQKYPGAYSEAIAIEQMAFRAYTSVLEIIAGEEPCDPIKKTDDD